MSLTIRSSVFKMTGVAAAVALVATGCATGTGGPEEPEVTASFSPDTELSGELTVMGFGTSDEIGQTRYDLATEELANVDVSLVEGQLNIQQFLSAVATGEPPQLIYADRNQIGTFASRGAIMPLDKCISGEGIEIDNFLDTAVEQVTFDGKIYGVPEFNQVQVLFANSELLAEADMELSDVDGSDWDRIEAAAEAMVKHENGDLKVIGYDTKLPEFLPLWTHANGGALISEDGRTAQLNSPEVVEALTFASSIYELQGGFSEVKAYRDSTDFFGAGNQFATGTLGAMPMEQWYINVLNDVSPDAPVTFTTFKTKDGEPFSYSSGSTWAIPAESSNPEAACRFIKTMTATESWMAAAEARATEREKEGKPFTGLFTANVEADKKIKETFVEDAGAENWNAAIEAAYEANDNGFSLPANPADAQFQTIWQDAVNSVLNGQKEPQEALDQAQEKAQSVLDKAWESWESGD